MAIYHSCRNCGNSEEGDKIYQCEKCGKVFCRNYSEWSGIILTNLRNCPACGEWGSPIGSIESELSEEDEEEEEGEDEKKEGEDDDEEEYSSSRDPELLVCFSEMREYLEKPKEKQSPELLDKLAKGLFDLNWSKYPEARSLYYEICPMPSSSSSNNNSSSNSSSSGNNNATKQDEQGGGGFFLFIVVSIIGLIAYNIPTSKESSQSINRISEQRPANLESDVSLGMIDKPVEHEKLAGDAETIITRDNDPIAETPPLQSAPAQHYLDGTVEYVEPINLHIRSTGYTDEPVDPSMGLIGEKIIPGLRIFVQLDNGRKAAIIMDYDGNFNPEERVSVISRNSESNGTVEYARYDYLESVGEQIIDSEIVIKLDNGGRAVVILPDQEKIFFKGERVHVISKIIK